MAAAVMAGWARSTTFIVTLRKPPDRFIWLPRMSSPGTLVPPITGYFASPEGSPRPNTGAFDGPDTEVPNSPSPDDCLAIVITPAPAWSTNWPGAVNPGWARPLDVSSYTTSAAPVLSIVTTKKSARF